jgi:hypothetical protein
MDKRKGPESYEDLVKALADLFDEIGPVAPEEVDRVLIEAGYDPSTVATRMNAIAHQAMQDSPLSWRNRALKAIREEQSRLEKLERPVLKDRIEVVDAINELIRRIGGEQYKLVGARFRNLEDATDNDLVSLLSQLEYLASQQVDGASDAED